MSTNRAPLLLGAATRRGQSMHEPLLARAPLNQVRDVVTWSLLVLLVTAVHHFYGAITFNTPRRLLMVYASAPAAILIVAGAWLARSRAARGFRLAASWLALLLMGVFCIAMIGFLEGGLNHSLSNIAFALGAPDRAELYKNPGAVFFEVSGIAQFVAAIPAAHAFARLWRS